MMARNDPDLVEIDFGYAIPSLPVWLAAHQGLRHTPRVRLVWGMLFEELSGFMRVKKGTSE